MINRLPASEERRLFRGLEKAVSYTRTGMDPDAAMIKMAREFEFTPELVKRACEAFNKSKTVYMLLKRAADQRAEAFPLSDPDKVVRAVFSPSVDAGIALPKDDFSSTGLAKASSLAPAPGGLRKAAAEASPKGWSKPANEVEYRRDLGRRMTLLDQFDRQRSEVNQSRILAEESINTAVERMRSMQPAALRKVAHTLVNRYGDVGVRLMRVAGVKLRQDLPLEKTAHGAVLPLCSPYVELEQAVEHARQYSERRAALEGMAKKAAPFFRGPGSGPGLLKKAAEPAFGEAARGAVEDLAAGTKALVVDPVASIPSTARSMVEYLRGWHQALAPDPEDTGSQEVYKALSPEFLNRLSTLDLMQSWVKVAADPFVKNYPIADITGAYNNVINTVPSMRQPRMHPALLALVKRQLAQKQLMDPAEIEQLAKLESTLEEQAGAMAEQDKALQEAVDTARFGTEPQREAGAERARRKAEEARAALDKARAAQDKARAAQEAAQARAEQAGRKAEFAARQRMEQERLDTSSAEFEARQELELDKLEASTEEFKAKQREFAVKQRAEEDRYKAERAAESTREALELSKMDLEHQKMLEQQRQADTREALELSKMELAYEGTRRRATKPEPS